MVRLAERHPCRGILVVTSPEATALESAISAHCWRTASGGRHTCAEEILLRSHPGGEQELASAVLALLVPEVPVNVWLFGDLGSVRFPEDIAEATDRLLVDSAGADALAGLRSIEQRRAAHEALLVDLAWVRTQSWRELIAQLFDGQESSLAEIQQIEISGGQESLSSAALVLAGWLASRLDYSIASADARPDRVAATYYAGTRGVEVRIKPSESDRELARVVLHTRTAEFTVELHEPSDHLHIRSDATDPPVHRVVAHEPDDDASVLLAGLEGAADDGLYAEAAEAALALFEG
jgi:glucose-6-phosphate dehydrogenase assembly protein OpcA